MILLGVFLGILGSSILIREYLSRFEVRAGSHIGKKVVLKDAMGNKIVGVKSFNTKTKIAQVALKAGKSYAVTGGKVVSVAVRIPEARLFYKNGEEFEN